jgi:predicted MFS family arabinose efflux permease
MSVTSNARSYRELLADRPLCRAFLINLVGRWGYALLPLCLLFTIAQSSGSFTLAATATALFGVSGLIMPLQARLLDRHGQRRVLPLAGVWFTAFLLVVAIMGRGQVDSATAWIALCLVGGLGAPSLGPSMRAQWREATTEHQRPRGYSLDAVAEETLFFLGPITASGVLATGPAWRGVAAAAALIPVGVIGLITSPYSPPRRPAPTGPDHAGLLGPLRVVGFRRLVMLMAAAGTAMSAAVTLLAGKADRQGMPSVTGLVEAAAGLTSVLGALWWGRHPASWPWPRQLAVLLAIRVPLTLACLLHPSVWTVATMLVIAGFVVAPLYVVAYTASDHETDPHHHTEASTWVTSLNNIGISSGTAIAGWLFVRSSAGAVLWFSLVLLVLAVALAAGTKERKAAG